MAERKPTTEEAIDFIATRYFQVLRGITNPAQSHPQWLERVKREVDRLRAEGFSAREMLDRISSLKGRILEVEELFSSEERAKKHNLIEPGKNYYHNELKLFPPPPVRYYDEDLEEWIVEYKPEPIRIKERYTTEDVLEYFYRKFPEATHSDRERAAMIYLVTQNSLDDILFTIDVASESERRIRTVMKLSDFLEEGTAVRQRVKERITNLNKESGGLSWIHTDG